MFDDWCGLDFGKYAFPLMILGSLALHVWDVTSDVLVAIVLYNQDIVYFGVSIGIMVLGSLFSSFASVFRGSLRSTMNGKDPEVENAKNRRFNLLQLPLRLDPTGNFRRCLLLHPPWKKNSGFRLYTHL